MSGGPATSDKPRIGLALSGGGARGLAHIPVVEALDEMGVVPSIISGTSIGAIVGAGRAAGMSGREIRESAIASFANRTDVLSRLWKLRPKRVVDLFAEGALAGQFDAVRLLDHFLPAQLPRSFEELEIPLKVIATDFYGWRETTLESGQLIPALAASAALPMLFRPVRINDRVLIDGGITNPLPFDVLKDEADIIIAVDVVGGPIDRDGRIPGPTETMFGTFQILMQSIHGEKMRHPRTPDVMIRPPDGVRVLEFLKAAQIMKTADTIKDDVKRLVDAAISKAEQDVS